MIRAEAAAVNKEQIETIEAIFADYATIVDYANGRAWESPVERYHAAFLNTDYKDVEHYDILEVAPITAKTAHFVSGSRGLYRVGRMWKSFDNPATYDPPAAYGSDHWVFGRTAAGCWVITRFEFNASIIPFP